MEEDPDVRGGGRAAEDKRIKRQPDLADDRTSGDAEPRLTSNQLPPIQDKVRWRLCIVACKGAASAEKLRLTASGCSSDGVSCQFEGVVFVIYVLYVGARSVAQESSAGFAEDVGDESVSQDIKHI